MALRFINSQKMPKKKKINKSLTHPKWGKIEDTNEIKERQLIAKIKGVRIYAVFLK